MDQSRQQIDTGGGPAYLGNVHIANGDFIGRDQVKKYYVNQVTTVFLPRPDRGAGQEQPYFAGQPFRVDDSDLFTGRGRERDEILGHIRDPAALATVIYGPADVGKTSFLSAGVLPKLGDTGADVIPLRDYGDAASLLRALLLGHAEEMKLDAGADAPVPELARAIIAASSRRMVWLFDQFERFFLPDVSASERDAFRNTVGETLAEVNPEVFQILIAIRDDWWKALDRQWGDVLPSLRQSSVNLPPLGQDQAKVAILRPWQARRIAPSFEEGFLDRQLLGDLDRLSLEQSGRILPADLQIVCHHLFETAYDKGVPNIDSELYSEATEGKGAEWVLDHHFEGLLGRVEAVQRERAVAIATEMLAQSPHAWVVPDRLPVEGATPAEVAETLEEMAEAELLVWHLSGEQRAYAFSSNSIARAAERALGREAQKRLQARRELDYVWRDWLANDEWASQSQLYLLQDHYGEGPFPAERGLVVLRSAVTREMPVQPWLERLDSEPARDLVHGLEKVESAVVEGTEGRTRESQAGHILGLFEEGSPARPQSQTFGPVAWAAAVHRKWQSRETAVLALMIGYGQKALARVEAAVAAAVEAAPLNPRQHRRRLAELRGIVADADDEIAKELRQNERRERLATWWWRFRRRVRRDWRYILGVAAGGAVGAGLALGVLRFLMAPLTGDGSGYLLYSYFPTGFLLGGALSLGLLLVNPVRLQRPEHENNEKGTRPLLPAMLLGAVFFAGMHVLLMLLLRPAGLVKSPLIPPLALMAGAGLSYAVHDQPLAGWRIGAGRWLLRLAVVAAVLSLVQVLFVAVDVVLGPAGDLGTGLMFAWSGYTFKSGLYDILVNWGLERVFSVDNWFHYPALVDAALTGIAMALGLSAGLIVAYRWYLKWKSLVRRAGE